MVKPDDFAWKPIALIAVAFLAWSTPASRSSSQADALAGRTKLECLSAAAHDPKSAGTPMVVISAFCQCSAVAIVRSLTPVEISLALTNGGEIVPDEKVEAAAELCVDTVGKAQQR
jgi:hypothetical protein